MTTHGFCRQHRKASELPPSEMTRAEQHETSFSPDWEHVFEGSKGSNGSSRTGSTGFARARRSATAPYTEAQALMEAPPGAAIPKSHEEGFSDHERIVDAIDRLDPRSKWIFDAMALGGKSLRTVAAELNISKTHIDRLYKAALAQLQTELKDMV